MALFEYMKGPLVKSWEFDTTQDLQTVNGAAAEGASISRLIPVGQGHIVINSGYGLYSHEPGNALLFWC